MYYFSRKKAKIEQPNVQFYSGKKVYDYTLKDMHKWGQQSDKYKILERKHDYIQWLFPSPQQSMFNCDSYALQPDEMEEIRNNKKLSQNFVKSYKMMLDFYGMGLENEQTGKIMRNENFQERYDDAIGGHNLLRICRILTCLTCIGFRRYAIQLVEHLRYELNDTFRIRNYDVPNSFKKYYQPFGINYELLQVKYLKDIPQDEIENEIQIAIQNQIKQLDKATYISEEERQQDSVFFTKESQQQFDLEVQQIEQNYKKLIDNFKKRQIEKQQQIIQEQQQKVQKQQSDYIEDNQEGQKQQIYTQENQKKNKSTNEEQKQNSDKNLSDNEDQQQQQQQNLDNDEQQNIQEQQQIDEEKTIKKTEYKKKQNQQISEDKKIDTIN